MSQRYFVGGKAIGAAQVWKGTITTNVTADAYTVTLTDESGRTSAITYTVTNPPDTTTTLVATGFITAWNASTDPLISQLTATQLAGQVILTADTAGVSFYAAATASGGSAAWTGTGNTTPNTAPDDLNVPSNYVPPIVPVASDDVTFVSGTIAQGLRQAAVFTGKMVFAATFNKGVGSAGKRLSFTPSSFLADSPSGSAGMFLDFNGAAIPLQINGTPSPSTGFGIDLIGSALTTVTINGGSIGIAVNAGDTATIATLSCVGGTYTLGSGVTISSGSILQSDGTGVFRCNVSVVSIDSGTLTSQGTATIATATVSGGTFIANSSGTITTLNVNAGVADFNQSRVSRTVASCTFSGGQILRDSAVVTLTNGIQPSGNLSLTAKAAS